MHLKANAQIPILEIYEHKIIQFLNIWKLRDSNFKSPHKYNQVIYISIYIIISKTSNLYIYISNNKWI